jgi:hypothetical protein
VYTNTGRNAIATFHQLQLRAYILWPLISSHNSDLKDPLLVLVHLPVQVLHLPPGPRQRPPPPPLPSLRSPLDFGLFWSDRCCQRRFSRRRYTIGLFLCCCLLCASCCSSCCTLYTYLYTCPLFCRRRLSNPTAENSVPGQTTLVFTLANILDRAEAEGNITSPECRLALLNNEIRTTWRWSLVRSEKNEAKAKYSLSPVSLMLQVSSPDLHSQLSR